MTRRLFFERIATAFASVAIAPVAQASASMNEAVIDLPALIAPLGEIAPAVTTRLIDLQHSPIAGFQYHQGELVWAELQVGAKLTLVRKPENIYDNRAVRVEWHGHKLGYVPRHENAAVCHLLDSGEMVTADIAALNLSHDHWDRIEFVLYLNV